MQLQKRKLASYDAHLRWEPPTASLENVVVAVIAVVIITVAVMVIIVDVIFVVFEVINVILILFG